MTDRATDLYAIGVITHILNKADAENADAEYTARAILAALHGHGWRPTQAQPPPPWRPAGEPSPPTDGYRQARAIIAGRQP